MSPTLAVAMIRHWVLAFILKDWHLTYGQSAVIVVGVKLDDRTAVTASAHEIGYHWAHPLAEFMQGPREPWPDALLNLLHDRICHPLVTIGFHCLFLLL
jgi:hypothetical protein